MILHPIIDLLKRIVVALPDYAGGGGGNESGTLTIVSSGISTINLTHNLGTKKVAVIIRPISTRPTYGYQIIFLHWLNIKELIPVDETWEMDFTFYNSGNFPSVLTIDPRTDTITPTGWKQGSPWTSQTNWSAANDPARILSGTSITADNNSISIGGSGNWAPGTYEWTVFSLE